ncbi:Putative lipoprotein precursor [Rhodovulum sp. P5]|uniref:DUF3833 domain-containing protein n=1 Tax=Rhodovulum sp. P5 TaxID=1564506 RepID=UPI0009C20554|nr:DUF3833 domain-containing protein [Rhodovulum sp. P5]ARE40455.1 Putative lipoprotein precursor [Rhodovulum sp. P5]
MTGLAIFVLGLLVAFAAVALKDRYLGFKAQGPGDYANAGPDIDLRRHLNGPILCEGVIYGPTGRVTSRFVADFDATWEGDKGQMTEEFTYDSGATQSRIWTFSLGNDGTIRADAPDLVGSGHGMQMGSAIHLRYRIRLPADSGGHVLDVTDWMYLMENGAIMNRSQFSKFGIKVAELVATMRPKEAA